MSVVVLVSVLLLLAGTLELTSRWWIRNRSGYYVLPPGLRMRLRPDPDVFPRLESDVRFDVNRDGERGDDLPRSRAGLHRVLVAGGSQAEGYLLDQRTYWPGRLQSLLREPRSLRALRASAVHVGSIARSGVGSEALDIILERVLGRYPRLQLIIILVGASDMLKWLELGAPPTPSTIALSDIFRCHREFAFGWTPRRLACVELLRRLRHRWTRPVQVQDRACRWMGRARAMRAGAKEIRTEMPEPRPMLDHFTRHFRGAVRKAQAHADRVLVVRQPWFDRPSTPDEVAQMWHGGVGQAWRETITTFYSLDVLSRLMSLLDECAGRVATELNVDQLDLRPLLDPSVENYYDFFHTTPAGSLTIARAVAAAVLRVPVLGEATDISERAPELQRKVS